MRILFLSLYFILQLEASEIVLSAILGELISDKKIALGEKLILNKKYKISQNSKIQILINKTASITMSQNSEFSIAYLNELTCKLNIKSGTYKIFNLSSKRNTLKLELSTAQNLLIINNSIALVKLTSKNLTVASAKNSLTLIDGEKKINILEDEMIKVQNSTLKKSKIVYDIFQDVFIKKDKSKIDTNSMKDSPSNDPGNLDN